MEHVNTTVMELKAEKTQVHINLRLYNIFPIDLLALQYHNYGDEGRKMSIQISLGFLLGDVICSDNKKTGINIELHNIFPIDSFSTSNYHTYGVEDQKMSIWISLDFYLDI